MSLPFVALALTTTGPDPRRDRVSGVSAVAVDASGERTRFDATVRTKDARFRSSEFSGERHRRSASQRRMAGDRGQAPRHCSKTAEWSPTMPTDR